MAKLLVAGPLVCSPELKKIVESELDALVAGKGISITELITNGAPGVAGVAEQWATRRGIRTRWYQLHRDLVEEIGHKVRDYRDRLLVREADAALVFRDFENGGGENLMRHIKGKKEMFTRVVGC